MRHHYTCALFTTLLSLTPANCQIRIDVSDTNGIFRRTFVPGETVRATVTNDGAPVCFTGVFLHQGQLLIGEGLQLESPHPNSGWRPERANLAATDGETQFRQMLLYPGGNLKRDWPSRRVEGTFRFVFRFRNEGQRRCSARLNSPESVVYSEVFTVGSAAVAASIQAVPAQPAQAQPAAVRAVPARVPGQGTVYVQPAPVQAVPVQVPGPATVYAQPAANSIRILRITKLSSGQVRRGTQFRVVVEYTRSSSAPAFINPWVDGYHASDCLGQGRTNSRSASYELTSLSGTLVMDVSWAGDPVRVVGVGASMFVNNRFVASATDTLKYCYEAAN